MMNTLQIRGMTCGHCVRAVTKALQGVAGVEDVSVDLGAGQARVGGAADAAALVRAIENEGYDVKLLEMQ
ncbi:MAG TPA: cation transporter [Burkholderiales bacterium]|jgi:copper chaperone|nr:cation transporter [Burkholderiales bacterium]